MRVPAGVVSLMAAMTGPTAEGAAGPVPRALHAPASHLDGVARSVGAGFGLGAAGRG